MTGYTVHTGSTVKFSSSWDRIFSAATSKKSGTEDTKAKKRTAAKPLKKSAKKKSDAKPQELRSKTGKAAAKKLITKRVKRLGQS